MDKGSFHDLDSGWLRFGPLLVSLSVVMLAAEPLSQAGFGRLANALAIPVVLGASMLAIQGAGRIAIFAVGIWAALTLVRYSVIMGDVDPIWVAVGRFVDAAFVGFVTLVLLLRIIRSHEVSVDTILGGVSVYLFFSVMFASLFSTLEFLSPGSFLDRGEPLLTSGAGEYVALSYFSLVTLTTLGFGDIVPTTPIARSLVAAEAVIGQLYIAVLISFLVGVHISQREAEVTAIYRKERE